GPGPIMDRTKEHLCAGDISTIKARLKLLDAARALREKGTPPPGAKDAGVYRVRGVSIVVPDDVDWIDGVKEAMTVPPAEYYPPTASLVNNRCMIRGRGRFWYARLELQLRPSFQLQPPGVILPVAGVGDHIRNHQ